MSIEKINQLKGQIRISEPHRHNGSDSPQIRLDNLEGFINIRFTYNPSSLADGAGETKDVTAKGAKFGDYVLVSAPYDLQGILVTGYVKSAGTASIRLQNESGGVIDLAEGEWKLKIIKE